MNMRQYTRPFAEEGLPSRAAPSAIPVSAALRGRHCGAWGAKGQPSDARAAFSGSLRSRSGQWKCSQRPRPPRSRRPKCCLQTALRTTRARRCDRCSVRSAWHPLRCYRARRVCQRQAEAACSDNRPKPPPWSRFSPQLSPRVASLWFVGSRGRWPASCPLSCPLSCPAPEVTQPKNRKITESPKTKLLVGFGLVESLAQQVPPRACARSKAKLSEDTTEI